MANLSLHRGSLTVERARELFRYDPETGNIIRRVRKGRFPAGCIAGSAHNAGYRRVGVDYTDYLVHRLAWFIEHGAWPEHVIDHKNTRRSDNRLTNLRPATHSENRANEKTIRSNSSGFKGASFHKKSGRWRAVINHSGSSMHLGLFNTPEEAHQAYVSAAKQYFGEFANAG